METDSGWWLVRHSDHARLAGAFAEAWGNEQFRRPEPRARVLLGISAHDDGWLFRDAHPTITREGKPSAFSIELVGKYSAFEEIHIEDYLAVRERAVRIVAEQDPYAALLILLHTCNLLTHHADRSTITPEGLALLDAFLERQRAYELTLRTKISADPTLHDYEKSQQTILEHFHLLQACDNLSLLACVAFSKPADLLHPLPLRNGGTAGILVFPKGVRQFQLCPWPFAERELTFTFPARHVSGNRFSSPGGLEQAYHGAVEEALSVTLSA